jgi:predicted nucleic acid-binding protein
MREAFVDTSFFVAILNPKDRLRQRAERTARSLGGVRLVTTDGVLTEVLNYFAEWGAGLRWAAVQVVRRTRGSSSTVVIPQTREGFDRAHQRYAERLDKGYSLTDCDAMLVMEDRGIQESPILGSTLHPSWIQGAPRGGVIFGARHPLVDAAPAICGRHGPSWLPIPLAA